MRQTSNIQHLDQLDLLVKKDYFTFSKVKGMHLGNNFESWGFLVNPKINDITYLAGFLVFWLWDNVFTVSFTTIRHENFLKATKVAKG